MFIFLEQFGELIIVEKKLNLIWNSENTVSYFEKLLGKTNVLTQDLDGYNTDWLGIYRGQNYIEN